MKNLAKVRKRSQIYDVVMTGFFYGVAILFFGLLVGIIVLILGRGILAVTPTLLSFSPDGIGNQLFNTVYLVFMSLLVSTPLGVATGVYMAEYAKNSRLTRVLRIAIETLSSLPSIVVGLFGYMLFIVAVGARWNMVSGALALSILGIPLIASTTEDALRSLPRAMRDGSLALGATTWQTIVKVLLPAARAQIGTGVLLAAGRGFGEAAALLYTSGMSTDISWSEWNPLSPLCPLNPFRSGETLALDIWSSRTEALGADAAARANVAAAVLVILIVSFGLGARWLRHKKTGKSKQVVKFRKGEQI